MKHIYLAFTLAFFTTLVIAQPENDEVFHAKIPTKVYLELQTGGVFPSLQDLKVSNLHLLGTAFPLYFGGGYEGKKMVVGFKAGFYSGRLSPLNGSPTSISNFRPSASVFYEQKIKTLSAKKHKIAWSTGGEIGIFYDLRVNQELENNKNVELAMVHLGWTNTFKKSIKIKKQTYNLIGQVTLPLGGYIGESQSFAFNIPQESFQNGIFNYQTFNPTTFKSMKLTPIGGFFGLNTKIKLERDFNIEGFNKKRRVKLALAYNWDYLAYSQVNDGGIQIASHQLLFSAKYFFTKKNHAGIPKPKKK